MSNQELICIICPNSCRMTVAMNKNGEVESVSGNKCKRGDTYVRDEVVNPVRVLSTIVRLKGGKTRMCPVKSNKPVPKELIVDMAQAVSQLIIEAPVEVGDVVVKNIMGTGADIVVTRELD